MSSSTSSIGSSSNSPCAACKFLRRKCTPDCIFAPYFPPEDPQKFANVHKVFGASNVTKLLNDLLPHQREGAVNSLAYEADARIKDPVYGCVGAISVLQHHVTKLQKELDAANADLLRYYSATVSGLPPSIMDNNTPIVSLSYPAQPSMRMGNYNQTMANPYNSVQYWGDSSITTTTTSMNSGGSVESINNPSDVDQRGGVGGDSCSM